MVGRHDTYLYRLGNRVFCRIGGGLMARDVERLQEALKRLVEALGPPAAADALLEAWRVAGGTPSDWSAAVRRWREKSQ